MLHYNKQNAEAETNIVLYTNYGYSISCKADSCSAGYISIKHATEIPASSSLFSATWIKYTSLILNLRFHGLLEKLTVSQLVKKFPAFYGTRKFITAFTTAGHLSLSSASSIQSMPHPTS
jgi:hypothetical protein